jgi:hypothetical protein
MSNLTWDDAFLDSLRTQADPDADTVVSELFAGTGDTTSAFRTLVVQHRDVSNADLAAFIDGKQETPSWLDPQRVEAGQELFARWGSHVFTALYAAALPSAYACWRGVQVLGLTARLETDTKRRLNETAQFHLDVMVPGGLEFGARGYADVRHVRLMHAAVRWLVQNDARVHWDPTWGTPINQEDLLETLLTFTEIVFEVFDKTGVACSEADADTYLHTWSLIGYYLGVRPDLLPLTRAQTSVLMPIVRRRQFGRSESGRALTAALLEQGTRLVPPGLRGLPASTLRFYVGNDTADKLGVPAADWTRFVFGPLADMSRRMSLGWLHDHLLRALSDRIGFGMLSLAVRAARYGERPAFAIPTSLAERWQISTPPPSVHLSVNDIAGMTDPILRNLWITQRYHELALQLRDIGAGEDATWCAFAVWASKTAGASIRGDVLPAKAQRLVAENEVLRDAVHALGDGFVGRVWRLLLARDPLARAAQQVTDDVARAIAEGNVLVFADLGPLFTTLVEVHRSATAPTPQSLSVALAPALSALESSGVDTSAVAVAFDAYGLAMAPSPDRAAMVLLATTLAVGHEQQRLQATIERALDAAISDTLKRVIEEDLVRHVPSAPARVILAHLTDDVCQTLDDAWEVAVTEVIMELVTSVETLDLRRDVPRLDGVMFPPALSDLAGSPAESEVALWDRTGGTGVRSGADDWAELEDRMNYIVNLFRSRQQDAHLFDPPFSDDQLAALARGQLPPGSL